MTSAILPYRLRLLAERHTVRAAHQVRVFEAFAVGTERAGPDPAREDDVSPFRPLGTVRSVVGGFRVEPPTVERRLWWLAAVTCHVTSCGAAHSGSLSTESGVIEGAGHCF